MPAHQPCANLKKDGPFIGALLFFVVSLGHDLLTQTFTASTAIFGVCVLVGIFQPALEHVVNRKREAGRARSPEPMRRSKQTMGDVTRERDMGIGSVPMQPCRQSSRHQDEPR